MFGVVLLHLQFIWRSVCSGFDYFLLWGTKIESKNILKIVEAGVRNEHQDQLNKQSIDGFGRFYYVLKTDVKLHVSLYMNRNVPVAALPVTQQMTEMSISREEKVTPKTETEPGMFAAEHWLCW